MNKEWKEKCDRLLAANTDKHNRNLQGLREEKEEVEEKLADLQRKVCIRGSYLTVIDVIHCTECIDWDITHCDRCVVV